MNINADNLIDNDFLVSYKNVLIRHYFKSVISVPFTMMNLVYMYTYNIHIHVPICDSDQQTPIICIFIIYHLKQTVAVVFLRASSQCRAPPNST